MIQIDKDGVLLFYIDANGKKIAHNFMEGAAYFNMCVIRDAQLQALRENVQNAANYETALGNAQINIGRPGFVLPAKPLMKVVADLDGAVTFVPFDPPLPDLVAPTVTPSTGKIAVETPDKQAILYNMVLAMFRKMFPDA